jgi:cobalt-zinc-cadmium efflux system protein
MSKDKHDHHDCDHSDDHAHGGDGSKSRLAPAAANSSLNLHKLTSSSGHGHHSHGGHSHGSHGASSANITFAFFLNFGFSIIELVGGLWIGSLAVIANAVHDFGDSVSLATAWFLERLANRSRDNKFNFGYRRFSLLSALVSGVVITTGSVIIAFQAIERFFEPHVPTSSAMMFLAIIGLAANSLAAWRMSHGPTQNEKVLTWHLFTDVAGWAIVLLGALVIQYTGWSWIDPALALGLAVFVSFNVFRYLKETAYLFLQGRPANFDEELFVSEAMAVNGVEKVDHLAIWSLDGESSVLSARLHLHSVRDPIEIERVKTGVRRAAEKQKARATLEICLAASVPHGD